MSAVKRKRTRLAAAYREAGHAVIAQYLGRGIRSIQVTSDHNEHVGACSYYPPRRDPNDLKEDQRQRLALRDILCNYAGQLAEAKFRRLPARWSKADAKGPLAELALKAIEAGDTVPSLLQWLFRTAKDMLADETNWLRIVAVARRLNAEGSLKGSEVRKIGDAALVEVATARKA